MAYPIFRYWQPLLKQMLKRGLVLEPHPDESAIDDWTQTAKADDLENPDFRRNHKIMLDSRKVDMNQKVIYEGDILRVYSILTSTKSRGVHGYVECLPNGQFVVSGTGATGEIFLNELEANKIEVLGNFFESPEWIDNLGGYKHLVERWSR